MKLNVNTRQKADPKDRLRPSGKMLCGQTNPNLKFFMRNMHTRSSGLQRRKTTGRVFSAQMKACCWCYGSASVPRDQAPLKGTVIDVFRAAYAPLHMTLLQGRACTFQHDNVKPHTASII